MSSALAFREMARFLSTSRPEVLSVSGRWGVGKTYGWSESLRKARKDNQVQMQRYSYVSAFGVRSIADLQTAVFQNTVRLDAPDIRPSLASLQENLTSIEGLTSTAEWVGRRAAKAAQRLVSAVSWAKGAADLILPAAGLLIRNQLICIDDIERTGAGLDVSDILGFVSMLREERDCKIVLLLNEEGLGEDRTDFRRYLEKVVDQAIQFTPTPIESASIALSQEDQISAKLKDRSVELGITNIRVIKRIRRFLEHLEPLLREYHQGVTDHAIKTLALFGWSIFEPTFAPNLDYIRRWSSLSFLSDDHEPSPMESTWNALLNAYRFSGLNEFDAALIDGLLAGAFDEERVRTQATELSQSYDNADIRAGIFKPWEIYGGSFEENEAEFVESLNASVQEFGHAMTPAEINSVVKMLRDLGGDEAADNAIEAFMAQQGQRPREFFELTRYHALTEPVDPALRTAFQQKLAERPLERDPAEILVNIERLSGWNPEDIEFLASLSEDQFYELFKAAKGDDLRSMMRSALRFSDVQGAPESQREVGRKARAALQRIADENQLNRMRLRPYLSQEGEQEE